MYPDIKDFKTSIYKWKGGKQIAPIELYVVLASTCTLRCVDCHAKANAGLLSPKTWIKLFDEIVEFGVSYVTLGGGSLEHPNTWDILRAMNKKYINLKLDCVAGMLPARTSALYQAFNIIEMTLPGHDCLSYAEQTGSGNYSKALADIRRMSTLKHNNFMLLRKLYITASDIWDLEQELEYSKELGFDKVRIVYVETSTTLSYVTIKNKLAQVYQNWFEYIEDFDLLIKQLDYYYNKCLGAAFLLYVDSAGNVRFCLKDAKTIVSNITELDFTSIFISPKFYNTLLYLKSVGFSKNRCSVKCPTSIVNMNLTTNVYGDREDTGTDNKAVEFFKNF